MRTKLYQRFNCSIAFLAMMCVVMSSNFLSAEDTPALRVTAKELTTAYVKNLQSAIKKYGDSMNPKEMVVEGVVADLVDGTYGKIARLQGEGSYVVSCLLRKEDEALVKKGNKVTFKGKCRGLFKKDKSVDFNSAVLIKEKESKK